MTETYTSYPCPAGYVCPDGTGYWTDNPCPAGTFSNVTQRTDVSQCIDCPGNARFSIQTHLIAHDPNLVILFLVDY